MPICRARLALPSQSPAWLGHGIEPRPATLEEYEDGDADPGDRRRARIPLDPHGLSLLGALHLDAGGAIVSHLLIHLPDEYSKRLHQVSVRQTYRGKEIGRITWLLVPPPQ